MMKWKVEYTLGARDDIKALDSTQRKQVIKDIDKVSYKLLPKTEGGYGKPLGNLLTSNLSEFMKIRLLKLGLWVVYAIEKKDNPMKIVIVSVKSDEQVYKIVYERINKNNR